MALEIQTASIGNNFDGTPGQGEIILYDQDDDDTQRAVLLSVAVQSGEVQADIVVKLAPDLAGANGSTFIELANLATIDGLNLACCRCIVPRNWRLFVFTSGGVTTDKTLICDWYRATLEPRI